MVNAVFHYCWFVGLCQSYMSIVLFDTELDWSTALSNINQENSNFLYWFSKTCTYQISVKLELFHADKPALRFFFANLRRKSKNDGDFCVMTLQSTPRSGWVPSGLEGVLTQKKAIKNSGHRKYYESTWAYVHNCKFIGQSGLKFEVGRCGVSICLECVNMAVTWGLAASLHIVTRFRFHRT